MKEKEEVKKALEREKKKKDYLARKMHYLLSTQQIAGIYNSPYRKEPDPWEMQLRKAKPLRHKKKIEKNAMDLPWPIYADSFGFQTMPTLPPIRRQKPQGPFRDTVDVLQQRFKPLEPSVQVVASSSSLQLAQEKQRQEEWRNCIQDEKYVTYLFCFIYYILNLFSLSGMNTDKICVF
uniref:Uncharacterized protein n=1 Tax=Laticauda laticaudata TaxID=8630 RepID=A0A8C5SHU5_LATLA